MLFTMLLRAEEAHYDFQSYTGGVCVVMLHALVSVAPARYTSTAAVNTSKLQTARVQHPNAVKHKAQHLAEAGLDSNAGFAHTAKTITT